MSNKKNKKDRDARQSKFSALKLGVGQETKRSILGILSFVLAALFGAAPLGFGGVAGITLYSWFVMLFGVGYYLLPIALAFLGFGLIRGPSVEGEPIGHGKTIGAAVLFFAGTAILSMTVDRGGVVGSWGALPFSLLLDSIFGTIILSAIAIIGALIALDTPLVLPRMLIPSFLRKKQVVAVNDNVTMINPDKEPQVLSWDDSDTTDVPMPAKAAEQPIKKAPPIEDVEVTLPGFHLEDTEYNPPPLSLLERDKGKPETGDIKANANIIKRTLQNFGILVEMDEVSIGPTVTRFALKPAEGVRLQKIVSLQNNLELALAAAPVRIEAPIPGKSLVGIEVPNQKKAMVGLASLVGDDKFVNEKRPLYLALGRDIGGSVQYANLAKMPHLLIAGATGSGKSVSSHAIITSLL